MKSLWNDTEAKSFAGDPLQLRIYTSQLLGREPGLILHGGGNTSVKTEAKNFFGEKEEILFVKASGVNLAQIQASGFTPLKLNILNKMLTLDRLADIDLVRIQRSAMTDFAAPDPSIETLVHASIPFKYVDHTHADAVITLTNNPSGDALIREIYREQLLIVPYVKPGFMLAKTIHEMIPNGDWDRFLGMILMHHGVFSFADDARTSYERMIHIVSLAEEYLKKQGALNLVAQAAPKEDLPSLCRIRQHVSLAKGCPVFARLDSHPEACGFSTLPNARSIVSRGPITPDHLIHTKPFPVIFGNNIEQDIADFCSSYKAYFDRNTDGYITCRDLAPRWGVWPRHGILAFGRSIQETMIVSDIVRHTIRAVQWGEAIGGWQPLSEKEMFAMEYWELQLAKLRENGVTPELQGKIALITGAASGIGLACTKRLQNFGAAVVGLDINPEITRMFDQQGMVGLLCDITDDRAVKQAVQMTVRRFGGLDILISNAGVFSTSQNIEDMGKAAWKRSMDINLTSHQRLLKTCIPYLKYGMDPTVIFIGSKNVPAPGPGAAAYSVAKAGLTQLARVAAMELGPANIRVNVVHPNAVYDTALWTPEVLESRACHYGCTVEEYKTKNFLKTEVTSNDVAALICAMVGPAFAKTTGAQIPIDGGNERVI